jgi:hypothetical protein
MTDVGIRRMAEFGAIPNLKALGKAFARGPGSAAP